MMPGNHDVAGRLADELTRACNCIAPAAHACRYSIRAAFRTGSRSSKAAYVFFGQQGYRGMVRPHALRPIQSEVGYDGLLTIADHDGEVATVGPGFGVR